MCVHFSAVIYAAADQRQVTDKRMCLTVALFRANVKKHAISWRPCAAAISDLTASVPR